MASTIFTEGVAVSCSDTSLPDLGALVDRERARDER
jgi:malonate decarboxylase epsilon subunit